MVDEIAVEQAAAEVRAKLNTRMHFWTNRQTRKVLEARRRERRNAGARARADVMRSLGMKRTPYGWE